MINLSNNGLITATGTGPGTIGCLVQLALQNSGWACVALSGTFTATVQFEASADNQNSWVSLNMLPLNSATAASSATAAGTWQANVGGLSHIRVRSSAFTSGPITCWIQANQTVS